MDAAASAEKGREMSDEDLDQREAFDRRVHDERLDARAEEREKVEREWKSRLSTVNLLADRASARHWHDKESAVEEERERCAGRLELMIIWIVAGSPCIENGSPDAARIDALQSGAAAIRAGGVPIPPADVGKVPMSGDCQRGAHSMCVEWLSKGLGDATIPDRCGCPCHTTIRAGGGQPQTSDKPKSKPEYNATTGQLVCPHCGTDCGGWCEPSDHKREGGQ